MFNKPFINRPKGFLLMYEEGIETWDFWFSHTSKPPHSKIDVVVTQLVNNTIVCDTWPKDCVIVEIGLVTRGEYKISIVEIFFTPYDLESTIIHEQFVYFALNTVDPKDAS
jgi:hypothetical protein